MGDRGIILATVAYTLKDFSSHYGTIIYMLKAKTPVRTRLYQMSIAGLLDEISIYFDV